MEDVMLDIMYSVPSQTDVDKCVVTKEMVEEKCEK
jgi:ATP-dependent Clp protease ATP-binding subunit ClpX